MESMPSRQGFLGYSVESMPLRQGFRWFRIQTMNGIYATDMLGLRSAADGIFKGEFIRDNLINSALHADKVATLCK